MYAKESQNHRMFGVGRDLCGSSSPTPLPKQGHLKQAKKEYAKVYTFSVIFLPF